jgi:NitT/TauT family transport system substrate-binding protein
MAIVATVAAIITVYIVWQKEKQKEVGGKIVLKTARIGYQQTIMYLPLFVAKEQGYFKKHGVEVELVPFVNASEMMQALLAGQINATGMSALDIIANVEQEKPGQVKMYLIEAFEPERGYSPDYVIAKTGSGIKNLEDLRGKKLGVRSGITFKMYAKIILQKIGIDPEKEVELIVLAENLQAQALESGQIDALFTLDPTATVILDRKIGELVEYAVLARRLMKESTSIYPGSGVLSTDFVRRDPETARKIRDAIYEAVDYITLTPQEAKRLLPKYMPIASQIAEKVSLIKWVKLKDADGEKVQDLIALYYQNRVLKQNVDMRNAYLSEADLK